MAKYALMNNPALAVAPKGSLNTHSECGSKIEPVGTEGKWLCPECAKVGYPLKSPN